MEHDYWRIFSRMPRKVTVGDITVRDGFQHEERFISTEAKIFYAQEMILAGARELEITNLGNPKNMPQFKDAEQVLRALDKLKRFLPAAALRALAGAFEVHVLTIELDAATADRLHSPAHVDDAAYAAAYRAAGRRQDRDRQITLIGEIGTLLDSLAHRPEVGLAIRLARGPAHAAGYGQLQDFLERGYDAFRTLDGAGEFLAAIDGRERELMHRLLD